MVALYNYEARDSSDVSFKKGDRMEVIDDSEGDWLNVIHLITKVQGYIPGNFVAAELSVESEELVFLVFMALSRRRICIPGSFSSWSPIFQILTCKM